MNGCWDEGWQVNTTRILARGGQPRTSPIFNTTNLIAKTAIPFNQSINDMNEWMAHLMLWWFMFTLLTTSLLCCATATAAASQATIDHYHNVNDLEGEDINRVLANRTMTIANLNVVTTVNETVLVLVHGIFGMWILCETPFVADCDVLATRELELGTT